MELRTDYENLILEGGGVLSFAYCGAILELDRFGILQNIKRFAGTSVGGIFASLLAADFTAKEIWKLKQSISFAGLSLKYDFSSIFNISKNYGINSTDVLRKQIQSILNTRLDPDVTLSDLFNKTGKELVLVSCCLNREKPVYFHHSTYGNVKLIDAIIASLSIPLFFQPLPLTVFGGIEDYFVDGGIVDNYPIWIFNNLDSLYQNDLWSFDREQINPLTLGLKLLSNGSKISGTERQPVSSMFNFFTQIINTLTNRIDVANISVNWLQQTILIPTCSIYFLDFDINEKQISDLIDHGSNAIKKHFENIR